MAFAAPAATCVCRMAPPPPPLAAASVSGRWQLRTSSYRAARCWWAGARRWRRRRWGARCAGQSVVKPGTESESAGEGLDGEGPPRPPFDLNLAVVLAGFAFEAYTSPPEGVGWRETDAAECQTVFLSDSFLREVYDGQLAVRVKKGINLPAMDPWVAAWDANLVTPHKRMGNAGLCLESLCDGRIPGEARPLRGRDREGWGHQRWRDDGRRNRRQARDEAVAVRDAIGGVGRQEFHGEERSEVRYKSYDDIEREKQWWRIPFVSDFLVKSSLGSALRTVLGSESINASQFVQSAFGQLSTFTYTYLPKPPSLDNGAEASKRTEDSVDNSVGSDELEQQTSGDSADSHSETESTATVVNNEQSNSPNMKASDEYFWNAFTSVLNQNVLQNFGFSLPEVRQLDGFDLLGSLGLKSSELAEKEYLESGLATADTSTSEGQETAFKDATDLDNKDAAIPIKENLPKEELQSSFPDINKVSRDVLSQTENILGALMILSRSLSPQDNESVVVDDGSSKDDLVKEEQGASDSTNKDAAAASTEVFTDAQEAEDMRQLFASAETAMEAWAMLATSLGRNSFIKSDFEKICFLDNVSTDTQVAIWRDSSRRRLVVAFRGTEQSKWKDLVTDLMLVPAGLNPERLGGDFKQEVQVHSGFLSAYDSVRNRIIALVNNAVGYMDEDSAENIPKWHVYVTGHSLGGALATLLALELSSSQMAKSGVIFVTMYNFGSPRVGNRRFAEVYNATVKDSWRVVNHRDIIPTVPRLMGYCHVEAPVYLKFGDLKDALVNEEIIDDEGDSIGEYTPDVLVSEFMKGEKQLVEKLLQTEINLLRSIRDGSALMQHMEDFYYVTLLEKVRSRYQTVDNANEDYRLRVVGFLWQIKSTCHVT
uniref:Fungal lipase-type domain-containing protein n=1 Tax=Leersia perrieri TaxID=77586 RepID=A0A0D9W705_9ORYZ